MVSEHFELRLLDSGIEADRKLNLQTDPTDRCWFVWRGTHLVSYISVVEQPHRAREPRTEDRRFADLLSLLHAPRNL